MVAASLLDNYNKIVQSIRNQPSLVKTSSGASAINARASLRAGTPVNAGAIVFARLSSVKVYSEPKASSKVVGTLKRSDEAIASGEEENGFVRIDSDGISGGWVQRTLVGTEQTQQ
jgi:hypothetical protein